MKTLLTVVTLVVTALAVWFISPQSAVAKDPVYEKAAAWCEARLSALPRNHESRLLFEHTLRNIKNRSGIDYELLVFLAKDFERTGGRFPAPTEQ